MSKSNWGIRLTVGLIALCIYDPVSANEGRNQRASEDHHEAQQHSEPADILATQNEVMRIARDVEALKADKTSEKNAKDGDRDLAEKSYKISFWTFWIAFGSLLVTGIGTYVIWDTLKHTAKAAEIGVLNSRPWIDFGPIQTKSLVELDIIRESNGAFVHIPIEWRNLGHIPATHFQIQSRFYDRADAAQPMKAYRELMEKKLELGWVVFPEKKEAGKATVKIPREFSGDLGLIMIGVYKMAGAKTINATPVVCIAHVSLVLDNSVLMALTLDVVEGITAT